MSFIGDASLALKIFGIMFVFYWVERNIENRLLSVLILVAVLYYFLFYAQSIFWVVIVLGLLIMFPAIGQVQDIYFQYDNAKMLSSGNYAEEAAIAAEAQLAERMGASPYGPRWRR